MPLPAGLRPVAIFTLLAAAAVTCIISLHAVSKGPDSSAHYDFNGRRTPHVKQKQHVTDLVYFNDPSIIAQLGCAEAVKNDELHNYTCFYQKPSKAADLASDTILLDAGRMCTAVYKPIPADFGRPWCIRQTKFGKTLAAVPKSQRLHLKGNTLVMGRLSGPNPTHHFYYIHLWMKQKGIKIGDLNLIIDCSEPPEWIGSYGLGLARAFGNFRFLHELPTATTFDEVRFSLPGTFPFDLHFYEVDKGFDCNMFELAWGVKQRVLIDPPQNASRKRVVVAQRRPS